MNEVDYTIMPLFSTPLYIKEYVPLSSDEELFLKSSDYERMEAKNGDYTVDKYILDKPELSNLKNNILECINEFVFGELKVAGDIQFYITNSWSVRHQKNDWSHSHSHTNSILSGVFYFDVNEDSGELSFNKESNHYTTFPMHMDLVVKEFNILNSKNWAFTPKNNQLFIFPPWLLHNVGENKSDKERYSLAFNVYIKGKIGFNEFQLELK